MSCHFSAGPNLVRPLLTLSLAVASLFIVPSHGLDAQQSSLRAERTLAFATKVFELPVKVGPVAFTSVEISNLGKGGAAKAGGGTFGSRFRAVTSTSETSTTLRARFLAENPTSEDWTVTFTVEFLDRSGKVIDKVTKKESWEGEAKPYDFDHEILEYVVPLIAQVKITMEARR
jgi:hypothetical protein